MRTIDKVRPGDIVMWCSKREWLHREEPAYFRSDLVLEVHEVTEHHGFQNNPAVCVKILRDLEKVEGQAYCEWEFKGDKFLWMPGPDNPHGAA